MEAFDYHNTTSPTRDQHMKNLFLPFTVRLTRQSVYRHTWNCRNGASIAYGRATRQMSVSRTLRDEYTSAVTKDTETTTDEADLYSPHGTTVCHDPDYLEMRGEPSLSAASFRSVGVEPSLVKALRKAFPNVRRPTAVQARLIGEILEGRDILLKDDTGSGKSVCKIFKFQTEEFNR